MSRDSFVLYTEYLRHVEKLNNEQRGILFTAILRYVAEKELPEMDMATDIAFSFIQANLDRDAEKYRSICEARRQAGLKGGRPKANGSEEKQKKQMVILKSKRKQKNPDNDNENDNENDNDNDKEIITSIVDAWNSLSAVGIPSISIIRSGSKRYKSLTARIKEYGQEDILKAIDNIRNSKFLQGKNERGWVITFDWLLLPSNFPKVLEGNYQDREGEKKKDANSMMMSRNYDWAELEKQLLAAQ